MARRHSFLAEALWWGAALLATLWLVFPLSWMVVTSFKRGIEVYRPLFLPFLQFQPTLGAWRNEFLVRWFMDGPALLRSLVLGLGTAALALALGGLAAYALARVDTGRLRWRALIILLLLPRFLPPVALVLPFFLIMRAAGLLDTLWALIIANSMLCLPFAFLILRDAYRAIPPDLEEAARVDGCSAWQAFWRVAWPLTLPAVFAAGLFAFAFTWNEFLFAVVLTNEDAKPYSVVVNSTGGATMFAVRGLLAIAPPLLIGLVAQRYMVRALTFGAVK